MEQKELRFGALGVSAHLLRRMMVPFEDSKDVTLAGLASRDLKKAKETAEEWGIDEAFGSYEKLLADPGIEAVYIPLPNHLHMEWIKKAVDAGKHVLCEKPLTITAPQTWELMEYLEDKKPVVMEAFMYRYHSKWIRFRELVQTGAVGEVQSIHTIFSYHNVDPDNIRNIKDNGGGALLDIGCYAVSSARYLMGREPSKVMGLNTYSDAFETDILSSGVLDFNGARALFTVGTAMYPAQEVKVYGTQGTLEMVMPFNDPEEESGKLILTTEEGREELRFEPENQYGSMFSAFARAVRGQKEDLVTLKDSYHNMRILDALVASSADGTWKEV